MHEILAAIGESAVLIIRLQEENARLKEQLRIAIANVDALEKAYYQQGREIAELHISNDAMVIAVNRYVTELQQVKLAQSK